MIARLLLAAVLVAVGAALLAHSAGRGRPSLHDAIRRLDGHPSEVGRRWRSTVLAGLGVGVVVLGPPWLLDAGLPWPFVAALGALAVGVLASAAVELRVRLRGRGTAPVVPLTFGWQRRLASRLVRGLTALWPVPPLRPAPRARSERPTAPASVRSDTRLLVVRLPEGAPGLRLWDVAERYLGSRLRYRDLLALNRYRSDPSGAPIDDDSLVGNGWTLLVPGDARGPGLVPLPLPGAAGLDTGTSVAVTLDDGGPAGVPAVGSTEPGPDPTGEDGEPVVPAAADPADPADLAELAELAELDEVDAARPAVVEPPGCPRGALRWDLVHARLLADGLLDTLDGLRERRRHGRAVGAGVPLPDPGAAVVEESAHVGADRAGAAFLELALRQFAAACDAREVPWPEIVSAHLGAEQLELRLAAPDRTPPAPFVSSESGSRWFLDRTVPLDDVPDVSPRLPGLVSVGPDQFGRLLLNLPVGGVVSVEGAADGCRLVALALAVELVVKRWSEAPMVNLVGFGEELAEFSPRLRYNARISQVLDRPVRGDVVILAEPPTDAALAALRVGAGSDWFSAPAVIVLGEYRRARWRLQLAPSGALTCPELEFTVGAQALSAATAAATARLAAVERTTELADVRSSTILLPRRADPDGAEVVLRLFGEPRLTRGPDTIPASARTVEIVALLALLGGQHPDDIAAAVWPHGVDRYTLHTELYEAAMTLGDSASGEPLLFLMDTVELASQVQVDWHLFVAAATAGADGPALALLGPTAADDLHRGLRHYPWLARLPLVRQLPGYIVDVATRHEQRRHEAEVRREAGPGPVPRERAVALVAPLAGG